MRTLLLESAPCPTAVGSPTRERYEALRRLHGRGGSVFADLIRTTSALDEGLGTVGRTIRGTLDLAFVENGKWVIVDFKTDLDARSQPQYLPQVQWYVLSQLMKAEAEGCLPGV